MMRTQAWWIVGLIMLLTSGLTAAQSGGQFCVRAFEDLNRNGLRDPEERLLTRGISANLLDVQNVTVGSAVLDQSPTASEGVICFTGLPDGQYTITITSLDFESTTPTSMTTSISGADLPTVMEFGAVTALIPTPTAAPPATTIGGLTRDELVRLLVAALGGLIVIGGMGLLGVMVYLIAFPRRRKVAADARRATTTGSTPAVRQTDTGNWPKV